MHATAVQFCESWLPDWGGCVRDIELALHGNLLEYEADRWSCDDLYKVLAIQPHATNDTIIASYGQLVGDFPNATEPKRFKKLTEAYDTLSNNETRAKYDQPCMEIFGACCGKYKMDGGIELLCGTKCQCNVCVPIEGYGEDL